ncbi:MAG: hypothetical protein R3F02_02690 [Thiolinea sp.]
MIKNIFWLIRTSLYSIVLSVLGSDNFLIPTEHDALRAMQAPMPITTSSKPQARQIGVQGPAKIFPQAVNNPKKSEVAARPIALQQTRSVYRCQQNNGQTLFSDKPCDNVQQVIPLHEFRPNVAETFQKATPQNIYNTTTGSNAKTLTRNPANRQEINTRYDNLSREIKHLLKDNPGRLSHLLLELHKDRQKALSMYATSADSYSIHQRTDNLKRDIRRQENQHNKVQIAHQLLELERQRNRELYDRH